MYGNFLHRDKGMPCNGNLGYIAWSNIQELWGVATSQAKDICGSRLSMVGTPRGMKNEGKRRYYPVYRLRCKLHK